MTVQGLEEVSEVGRRVSRAVAYFVTAESENSLPPLFAAAERPFGLDEVVVAAVVVDIVGSNLFNFLGGIFGFSVVD